MWVGEFTQKKYEEASNIICEAHKSKLNKIKHCDKIVKKKMNFFWTIKVHIMNPFYFQTPYPPPVREWLNDVSKLEELGIGYKSEVRKLQKEGKEIISIFDAVSTCVIAKYFKLCCFCDHVLSEGDVLNFFHKTYKNEKEKFDKIRPKVDEAIRSVPFLKVYSEICTPFNPLSAMFGDFDKELILAAVLFSYYLFIYVCQNPEEEYKHFITEINIMKEDSVDERCRELRLRGNDEYKNKNYAGAIRHYSEGLSLAPYSCFFHGNRGQALLKLNMFKEAEINYRASITACPSWPKGYYKLAEALEFQIKVHEAHIVLSFGIANCRESALAEPDCGVFYAKLEDYYRRLKPSCKTCITNKQPADNDDDNPPELESSDSDSLSDVPDLTDTSDSESSGSEMKNDDNKLPEQHKEEQAKKTPSKRKIDNSKISQPGKDKHQKAPVKNKRTDVRRKSSVDAEQQVPSEEEKMAKVLSSVKEASLAILANSSRLAVQLFLQVVPQIEACPQKYDYGELDMICLKYAFATACSKCGAFEDVQKAIYSLKDIIDKSTEAHFPALYYGLSLLYFKLNDFKAALDYLNKLSIQIELHNIFAVFKWPGTEYVIAELKHENLKLSVNEIINKCACPPPPDAVCRYESCSSQPVIYYSDLDFKGFMSVQCRERCSLQYHISCWKSLKELYKRSDKEFLDATCLTPDCGGLIIKVEIINKEGTIEKSFVSEESKTKNVKQKKSKLEKKLESKEEQRRRKRHRSQSLSESQDVSEEPLLSSENVNATETKPEIKDKGITKGTSGTTEGADAEAKPAAPSAVTKSTTPAYAIRKTQAASKDNESKSLKHKEHKERKKQKKSTLSLDEFCGGFAEQDVQSFNDYQRRLHRLQETKRVVEETQWPSISVPEIPSDTINPSELVAEWCPPYVSQFKARDFESQKEEIFLHFDKLLNKKGALKLNDPYLLQEIENLPERYKRIIEECGGFKTFIQLSINFVIVGNTLCFTADMCTVYNASPEVSELDDFNQVYETPEASELDDFKQVYKSPELGELDEFERFKPSEANDVSQAYGTESSESPQMDKLEDFMQSLDASVSECPQDSMPSSPVNHNNSSLCEDDAEKSTILNPNAAEYSPTEVKDRNSTESIVSAENNNSQSDVEPDSSFLDKSNSVEKEPSPHSKSLLSLVTRLRMPLSAYDTCCDEKEGEHVHEVKENGIPDTSRESCDVKANRSIYNELMKMETFKKCVRRLKKLLSSNIPDSDLIECLFEVTEILAVYDNALKKVRNCSVKSVATKCTQWEEEEMEKVPSQEVLDLNSKLLNAQNIIKELFGAKCQLSEKKEQLEEQLRISMDTATMLKNKLSVEMHTLDKNLKEVRESQKADNEANEYKISCLEKELQQCKQKYEVSVENEKITKKENSKLQVKLSSNQAKLKTSEERCADLEEKCVALEKKYNDLFDEMSKKDEIIDKCEKILFENQSLLKTRTKELTEAVERAKKAEIQILTVRKNEYLQRVELSIKNGKQKVAELEDGIAKSEDSLQPFLTGTLKGLIEKFNSHIKSIHSMRDKAVKRIEEQISELEDGKQLSELRPLELPEIPDLPTISDLIPIQSKSSSPLAMQPMSNAQFRPQHVLPSQLQQNFNFPAHSLVPNMNVLAAQGASNNVFSNNQNLSSLTQFTSLPVNKSMYPNPMLSNLNSLPLNQNANYSNFGAQMPNPSLSNLAKLGATPSGLESSQSVGDLNKTSVPLPPGLDLLGAQKQAPVGISAEAEKRNSRSSSVISENINEEDNSCVPSLNSSPPSRSRSPSVYSERIGSSQDVDDTSSVYSFKSLPPSASVKRTTQEHHVARQTSIEQSKTSVQSNVTASPQVPKTSSSKGLELGYTADSQSVENSDPAAMKQATIQSQETSTVEPQGKKNGYSKILQRLKAKYPNISEADLLTYLIQFRQEKVKLSGMSFDTIVSGISEIIQRAYKLNYIASAQQPRPRNLVNKPLVPRSLSPPVNIVRNTSECPWAKRTSTNVQWNGENLDKQCTICLEDMTPSSTMKVECGHTFHSVCIRDWVNRTSNCPICRVHLLLPEDYPALM